MYYKYSTVYGQVTELTSKDADERERQAFDAGFKTAMQLCRQLEDMGDITE